MFSIHYMVRLLITKRTNQIVPWGFMVYNNLVLGLHAQSQAAIDHKSQGSQAFYTSKQENLLHVYFTMKGAYVNVMVS